MRMNVSGLPIQHPAFPETEEPVSQAELQQQLVEWNATQAAYPLDRLFHELF
jgi:hypothetical protein